MLARDTQHLKTALLEGARFRGHTWPNPAVGCVIVNPENNTVIGTGQTQIGGRPHAEIVALNNAGPHARGAHAYITLEPCNHSHPDKPLSCTDALIQSDISRVILGLPDPDPRMCGQSIQYLRENGITVDIIDTLKPDMINAHLGYVTRLKTGRPHIRLKMAHSPDGFITTPGTRVNISSDASWQKVYKLRGESDAVLIGISTAIIDDPRLTDRQTNKQNALQPIRIVVDTLGQLPLSSRLMQGINEAPVWILTAPHANTAHLRNAGARIIPCPAMGEYIDMHAAMKILGEIGLTSIFAEGGAAMAGTLLKSNLVDDAIIIEGTINLGIGGIPLPPMPLPLTTQETIGPDTWRYYESEIQTALKSTLP